MKYTCYKIITTTLCEKTIDEQSDIKKILCILAEKAITCCVQFRETPVYIWARVLIVDNDMAKWRIIKDGSTFVKSYSFDEIISLDVDSVEFVTKNPNRWSTIDASNR